MKNREQLTDEDYQPYFDHFEPDLYDPREWARRRAEAGMRYAVLTTKHHEGFCLWDSALTDYTVDEDRRAGKDLVGAVRRGAAGPRGSRSASTTR